MKKKTSITLCMLVHIALLTVPIAVVGKSHALGQPKAIACIALLVLFSLIESNLTSRESHRPHPTSIASGLALLLCGWLSISAAGSGGVRPPEEVGSWMGVGIALSGILFRGLAIAQLGRHFSSAIRPTSPHLMTNGIYRFVRHPSELGLVLISIGLAVLGGSRSAAYVIGIVLLPSIVLRIVSEERALFARFGEPGR